MKAFNVFSGLFIALLLLSFGVTASADGPVKDPPKPAFSVPDPSPTPVTKKGLFDPVAISPATVVLDPATASISRLAPLTENKQILPFTAPAPVPPQPVKGSTAPGILSAGSFENGEWQFPPNSPVDPHSLLPGNTPPSSDIGISSSSLIKTEGFEAAFPNTWTLLDNNGLGGGEHFWGDVPCNAAAGSWSGWPAARGANAVNPCASVDYPNNVDSWLIYGPFSLVGAQSAWLDFYFRMISETTWDYLFWGASTNGVNFYGNMASGTHTSGLFVNGYNFASLDISHLAGAPQVWIAFRFFSDGSITAQGPFLDAISLRQNTDQRVYLTYENFDTDVFPNIFWESLDYGNTGLLWDDLSESGGPSCPAKSGTWSIWPADEGPNALNACQGQPYGNNMFSWMIHGPFNLTGASEAWIDLYFRNVSETNFDFLFWGVSTNHFNYYGSRVSGTFNQGPFRNGYNLMRLNLANVPTLGDLRGQPQVWLAFVFDTDGSVAYQGPFIDDVSVVVERPNAAPPAGGEVFLPIIIKSPPVTTPKTNLSVWNNTSGTLQSYRVLNVLLNNVPAGTINCPSVPAGQTAFCGTFDKGTYQVQLLPAACPNFTGGMKTFPEGNYTAEVRCPSP